MTKTYLKARYAERECVKALGAKWDPDQRAWYVPSGRDLASFAQWLAAYNLTRLRTLAQLRPRGAQ